MNKEELLETIREGMKMEESAVAIYTRHLSAIILRSGLPEEDIEVIKRDLELLIEANKRHKKTLELLVEQIQGESMDVY